MNDLVIMARYAKEHGMTYGQVALKLSTGELTHEEIGLQRPQIRKAPKEKSTERFVAAEAFTPEQRTCPVCGKKFIAYKRRARTCSTECAHKCWHYKVEDCERVQLGRYNRCGKFDTCIICGAEYYVTIASKLTCSDDCSREYRALPDFLRNKMRAEKAEKLEREAQHAKEK